MACNGFRVLSFWATHDGYGQLKSRVEEIFQGQMTLLLSHVQNKAPKIFLDGVMHTMGYSFNDGIKYLEAILEILKKAHMQFKASRSTWHATASEFRVSGLLMMVTDH